MAKKGIEYCCFGKLKPDGTYEAGQGKRFSPVVAYNFSPNNNSERDYGDNVVDDVDNETTGGTLTVELNRDPDEMFEYILGHALDSGGNSVTTIFNTGDVAPELGVGAVGKTGTRATGYKWRAKVYRRVVFAEPADDNQTKTNAASFGHTTFVGEVIPLSRPASMAGEWKITETFDTKAGAIAWLKGFLGVDTEPEPETPLAPLVEFGGTWSDVDVELAANLGRYFEIYLHYTESDPILSTSDATIVSCGIISCRGENAVNSGFELTLDNADGTVAVEAVDIPATGVLNVRHTISHLTNGERVKYRSFVVYTDINGRTRTYYGPVQTQTAEW